jgi:hypothetical protein
MCAVVGFLKQKKADPTMKMKKISAAAAGRVGHLMYTAGSFCEIVIHLFFFFLLL